MKGGGRREEEGVMGLLKTEKGVMARRLKQCQGKAAWQHSLVVVDRVDVYVEDTRTSFDFAEVDKEICGSMNIESSNREVDVDGG